MVGVNNRAKINPASNTIGGKITRRQKQNEISTKTDYNTKIEHTL